MKGRVIFIQNDEELGKVLMPQNFEDFSDRARKIINAYTEIFKVFAVSNLIANNELWKLKMKVNHYGITYIDTHYSNFASGETQLELLKLYNLWLQQKFPEYRNYLLTIAEEIRELSPTVYSNFIRNENVQNLLRMSHANRKTVIDCEDRYNPLRQAYHSIYKRFVRRVIVPDLLVRTLLSNPASGAHFYTLPLEAAIQLMAESFQLTNSLYSKSSSVFSKIFSSLLTKTNILTMKFLSAGIFGEYDVPTIRIFITLLKHLRYNYHFLTKLDALKIDGLFEYFCCMISYDFQPSEEYDYMLSTEFTIMAGQNIIANKHTMLICDRRNIESLFYKASFQLLTTELDFRVLQNMVFQRPITFPRMMDRELSLLLEKCRSLMLPVLNPNFLLELAHKYAVLKYRFSKNDFLRFFNYNAEMNLVIDEMTRFANGISAPTRYYN